MPRDPEQFPEDDRTRLKHMLEAARKAVRFCAGATRADLDTNDMLQLAVLKAIETVGEASSKVSDATRSSLPTIDWWAIRRMRNRLIHGYDTVDNSIVWDTVHLALPPLIADLDRALAGSPGPGHTPGP